ncbi:lipase family protein [Streptomyces chartreusis]|uniref:hypothetical protein n=1 Tax=Streptomyces chartreusis TaxID=1969 RepID=UPI003648214F
MRPDTIVLVHGFWVTPRSWENWMARYENKGFRAIAPPYSGFEAEVEALNADPTATGPTGRRATRIRGQSRAHGSSLLQLGFGLVEFVVRHFAYLLLPLCVPAFASPRQVSATRRRGDLPLPRNPCPATVASPKAPRKEIGSE